MKTVDIPECDAGQNSDFSANQWLLGQLPERQRALASHELKVTDA